MSMQRYEDLEKLRKIKEFLHQKKVAEKDRDYYSEKVRTLRKQVSKPHFSGLSTRNYEDLVGEISRNIDSKRDKKLKTIKIVAAIAIILSIIAMVIHMYCMHYESDVYMYLIAAIICAVIAACTIATIIVGLLFILCTLYALYMFFAAVFSVLWIYLVIWAVVIVVAVVASAIVKKRNTLKNVIGKHSGRLNAAKEQDRKNNIENGIREREARSRAAAQMEKEIDAAESGVARANQRIRDAEAGIRNLDCLANKDLDHVDFLIECISSHRADSIKEALALLDERTRRADERAMRALERDLQKIQQEREREAWEDEQRARQYWESERQKEHRKNVENTLDEISRKLDE